MAATLTNFRTACGFVQYGTSGFALPGNNTDFCNSILKKRVGGVPLRLESLVFVLPKNEEEEHKDSARQQVVVNLLLQLRAFSDQNNHFIQNRYSLQEQVTRQLHYALGQVEHGTRTQAEGIEHSIRQKLYQEGEFRKAVSKLETMLKKK